MNLGIWVFPKRLLRTTPYGSWGHTDSRVHCRLAACRLIDWVKSSNFISWLLYNRNAFLTQTCETVNKSSKSICCYIDSEYPVSAPLLPVQRSKVVKRFVARRQICFICCQHNGDGLILINGLFDASCVKTACVLFFYQWGKIPILHSRILPAWCRQIFLWKLDFPSEN